MGPVVPGGQLSQNHWSIYLLGPDGGSVRLNMELSPSVAGDKGRFTVTKHAYAHTTSAIQVFDYDVAQNTKVQSFLQVLGNKKRQNYKMTSTGVGCRFWVLTVINDWIQAKLITTANAAQNIACVIQFNYSKGQNPVKLEMKKGEWY
ncbi:hypothetical protein HRR83_000924 [Exophiala dermatitidis]|nr:hypothetical protein HRR75_000839 [Exophiala dermatitidis]KAJ4528173.1 hypothetical protein HRR74_000928 [Exophiala dermatitidis]KAJ4528806.1 hypothetical protein HRR73_001429 [Exophiala dermatitidis]KAJ4553135.1 hypothetical protein HRR78_003394 [Exophiala dermatitidis]KAJ4584267.1 hypothetical protein HRR81_000073 [Exophiala dermatitidis]